MDRTTGYFDLLEAFPEEGCPICHLGLSAVHRCIEANNYESVGDPNIRDQLRASLGFCNLHAYQWLRQAHLLGTASICVDVFVQLLAALQDLPFQHRTCLDGVATLIGGPSSHRAESGGWAPHGRRPICRVFAETEEMLVQTLLAVLPQPTFQDAYVASSGLCLPHLRRALPLVEDEGFFAI